MLDDDESGVKMSLTMHAIAKISRCDEPDVDFRCLLVISILSEPRHTSRHVRHADADADDVVTLRRYVYYLHCLPTPRHCQESRYDTDGRDVAAKSLREKEERTACSRALVAGAR